MAHRNDLTDISFARVFATFAEDDDFLDDAWEEFATLVDLDDERLRDKEDEEAFQALFYEWILFDYDIHGGKTALESYITWPPENCGANVLSLYAQAATSQFSSMFLVRGYDEVSHKVTLVNVVDGLTYRVFDRRFTETMEPDRGVLCARLIRIRGTWMFAGNIISYRPDEPPAEDIAAMRSPEGEHGDEFFVLVGAIYGREPLSPADSIASGFSVLSEHERGERLETAKREFADLQRGLELEVGWDDLTRMIREEDGTGSAVSLMDSIVGQKRVDAMDQDELVRSLKPILAAWNLLPHDILNGMTPVEDYESRYPAEGQAVGSAAAAADAASFDAPKAAEVEA